MGAGNLDQRVELWAPSVGSRSATGEEVIAWAKYATVWADAETIGSKDAEFYAAMQLHQLHWVSFTIRARSDVTLLHRVKWRGIDHEIKSIEPLDPRNSLLRLVCSSGSIDG